MSSKKHSAPGKARPAQEITATQASSPIRNNNNSRPLPHSPRTSQRRMMFSDDDAPSAPAETAQTTQASAETTQAPLSVLPNPEPSAAPDLSETTQDVPTDQDATQDAPTVREASPAPAAATSFAAAVAGKAFYVRPEVREALKTHDALSILDNPKQTTMPYGNNGSISEGHVFVRSYESFKTFLDIDAFLEGCSAMLRLAVMTAQNVVILDRSACGRSTIVFIRELPCKPTFASVNATSPFKGWRKRVRLVRVAPPHSLGLQAPQRVSLGLTLARRFTISGPTAEITKFVTSIRGTLIRPRYFGNECHASIELTDPQANAAKLASLLVAPIEATATSTLSSRMLTVEFAKEVKPEQIHATLAKMQTTLKLHAAITNFRGRLLLDTDASDEALDKISKWTGVKNVRRPFAIASRLTEIATQNDEPEAPEPALPAMRPTMPTLLVSTPLLVLPTAWVMALLQKLGPSSKLLSNDGAQALISTTAAMVEQYDNTIIDDALELHDFARVLADRKIADDRMRASLERAPSA